MAVEIFFSFFSKMASNALVYVTNNSKNNAQFKIKIILFSTVEVKERCRCDKVTLMATPLSKVKVTDYLFT